MSRELGSTDCLNPSPNIASSDMKAKRIRSQSGVSLGFVAMCAFCLAFLVYLAFQFFTLMGGSRECRNAVDAAVLNVSKKTIETKVMPNAGYKDCADSTGTIGLSNINRVWGKALLIQANQVEMSNDGQCTGQSSGNADLAYSLAQSINDSLVAKLNDADTLDDYFGAMAKNRHTKLLGTDSVIDVKAAKGSYQTAMIDRGAESNLEYQEDQMPTGTKAKPVTAGNSTYMQGYTPFTVGDKTFCFTSFRVNEMPHLISDTNFAMNSTKNHPLDMASTPPPNAWQAEAKTAGSRGSLGASAAAVTNPQRQYKMAIPQAYISIAFGNIARWYVEGNKLKETTYENAPESQWALKNIKLSKGGRLNGYASVGNEYDSASILKAINKAPGDYTKIYDKMLKRIKEIKGSYTMDELKDLLKKIMISPSAKRYFIFPVYDTPDYTNPTIKCQPDTGDLPEWLKPDNPADGLEGPASTDTQPLVDDPNYCWSTIIGPPGPTDIHHAELSGKAFWKPGTGFGQCLGEVRFLHLTEIKFTGIAPK